MVSKILIAFMAMLVVAMAFEFQETDEDFDVAEFMKRDPVMQDYQLAVKRGQSMKKYKPCSSLANCWCNRRGGKVAFCSGQGDGNGI